MSDTTNDGTTTAIRGELVQVDKALESSRDAGYDLTAAVGEVVDNSIDWGKASIIRIQPAWDKAHKRIDRMAFADNGIGIPIDTLAHVLSLGFSTGYGQRSGIGRFGVGLKLATLAQARRVDIYTRPEGDERLLHAYLDLDEVSKGEQTFIEARPTENYPEEFSELMDDDEGEEFVSGTLVIWSKIDRLEEGGRYGQGNDERLQELIRFLGRAYRRFIDNGLQIELDGREVALHDPLFLLSNPRVTKKFGADTIASVIEQDTIAVDDSEVEVTITVLPEAFRHLRRKGGRADRLGDDFADLYIPNNEGKISFLRQGREINYDLVAKMLPGGVKFGDRFIGIEVSFPATLDEYFQVRNVKRGVVPVSKLRDELRRFIEKPIKVARKQIKAHWNEVEAAERAKESDHESSEDAVSRAEQTTPRGRAGTELSAEEENQALDRVVEDVFDDDVSDEQKEETKARMRDLPISIVDHSWPGKELIEITHLNGKAVIEINQRHPFVTEVYNPVKAMADQDASEVEGAEAVELARKVEGALDLLFMAYAKAENMHAKPDEVYSDLRSDWGRFTSAYLREAFKDAE
jgi:Histidine kinase-, DNA gyrase B-, and HSP90-like ATPase